MHYASPLRSTLRSFLCVTTILTIIGCLFIYSASSVYALEKFGSASYFLKRHSVGLALGFLTFFITQFIPAHFFAFIAPFFFLATLGLTALTLIKPFGVSIHGSSRWLRLGPLMFQPSELLKVSLVMLLAQQTSAASHRNKDSFLRGTLPLLALTGFAGAIMLKQPDFGATITLLATALILLFIARYPLNHLLSIAAASFPLVVWLIASHPYRVRRILTFLNPWNDPHGAGFQLIQSLIAIGSGGLWGVGVAHSKQKFFYLPMQHTDFIFSIIAEETGLIGTLCIITLFVFLLFFGMRLANRVKNPFASLAIFGFIVLLNLQAIINIGVSIGMLPTKGIGLPLVSYGNSSLICNLLMIGIITNLARNDTE